MSPVSPVFHTEVTFSIGLKWVKTELAFCFEEWAFHYSMKEWAFCYEGRVLGFQIVSTDPYPKLNGEQT